MKKKVELSGFSVVMTILTFVILVGLFVWRFNVTGKEVYCWLLFGIIVVWSFAGLFYSPLAIELTDRELLICRSLKIKAIPLTDIAAVRLCPPTMGAKRICGSGGFLGYWGWFRERDLGKYFAYYGKASDCFLVELKNGRIYMLGCKDAPEMSTAISEKLAEIKVNKRSKIINCQELCQ